MLFRYLSHASYVPKPHQNDLDAWHDTGVERAGRRARHWDSEELAGDHLRNPTGLRMNKLRLRPSEAAEALSVSRSKLYELLASGALGSVRIGGSRRIPVRELLAYIDRLAGRERQRSSDTGVPPRPENP